MTLGTEKGETSSNILTLYPIQSNHCVKGLLMINTLWPHSRIYDFFRNAAPTYTDINFNLFSLSHLVHRTYQTSLKEPTKRRIRISK